MDNPLNDLIIPHCHCKLPVKVDTAGAEQPDPQDRSRKFIRCATNQCTYRMWWEPRFMVGAGNTTQSHGHASGSGNSTSSANGPPASTVKCDCNQPARISTSGRGGQPHNRGRKFACCAFYPKRCDYFMWRDGRPFGVHSQQRFKECMDAGIMNYWA
ncbi:hypothetical protein C8R43DRAFT_1242704 [Mycena crocata]|nr:hypothetical protein C8R43DRAFT_1242704 [Mycena crocata]